MRLIIQNFRGISEAEYKISNGSLILINGPSGVGKSSIFNAITWCLYGSLRNVDPHGSSKAKVCVSLNGAIKGLKITRKKNPGLLVVIKDNKEYEDDVAQSIIDHTFGASDLWRLTSYIPQGERNALLTSSNSDKMDILRQLAFSHDNPETCLETIDSHIRSNTTTLEGQKNYIQSLARDVSLYEDEHKITPDDEIKDLPAFEKSISLAKDKLTKVEDDHLKNEKQKALLDDYRNQFQELDREIKNLPLIGEQDIKMIEDKISAAKDISLAYDLKKQVDLLNEEITKLEPQIQNQEDKRVSDDDIYRAKVIEENYAKYAQICKKYDVNYDENSIKDDINACELLLQDQPYLQTQQRVKEVRLKLEKLPLHDKKVEQKDIDLLQERLFTYQSRSKLHTCPNCTIPLSFDGRKLQLSKDKPCSKEDIKAIEVEIEEGKKIMAEIREREQIERKLQDLEALLPKGFDSKTPLLNDSQIKTAKARIAQLRSIDIFNLAKVSSKVLQSIKKYQTLVHQRDELEIRYKPYMTIDVTQKLEAVASLEKQLNKMRRDKVSREEKLVRLSELERRMKKIIVKDDMKKLVDQAREDYENKVEKKRRALRFKDWQRMQDNFTEAKEKLNTIAKKQTLLETIKTKALLAQNKMLQDMVDTINASLADVGNRLFNSPITIKLQLFKRLKTTQQLKSQVNVNILYKGNEYSSIESMSGGEGDRVSLAFSIALNRISASPILMLDECMSSLDPDIREQCLESLRCLVGKTILVVSHDGVEGHFDETLAVKD